MEQSYPLLGPEDRDGEYDIPPAMEDTRWARFRRRCCIVCKYIAALKILWATIAWIAGFVPRLCYALTPQLVRTYSFNDPLPPPRIFPTSWLDGLRGLAAFAVFNFHYIYAFSDIAIMPYAIDRKHKWFIELPIIRLFYSGYPAVCIFFLAAGYVCSLRPLKLMSSKNDSATYQSLSTSLFRRAFRLYLPVAAITLLTALAAWGGLYTPLKRYMTDAKKKSLYFPGSIGRAHPAIERSLIKELRRWARDLGKMMSIWVFQPFFPSFDGHLWTVRIEFRSSIYLYAALLALARVRTYFRLVALFLASGYCFYWGRWEAVLFFWGACIAQFDIIRQERYARIQLAEQQQPRLQSPPQLVISAPTEDVEKAAADPAASSHPPTDSPPIAATTSSPNKASKPEPPISTPPQSWRTRLTFLLLITLSYLVWTPSFLLSLFLLSSPTLFPTKAPGYITLNRLLPNPYTHDTKKFFIPSLGATGLVLCLTLARSQGSPHLPLTHRALNTWLPQYLGKVMFALYLVHGPIMHMGGYWVPHLVWKALRLNKQQRGGWLGGLVVGWVINLGLVLWGADVFHREVVEKSVMLIQWIEKKVFVKE
jgi:peptidoglycan/LPS O-acetylase OafA/YrhL